MMKKTKRNIIRNIMVIFVFMVMYLAFKEPLDAKASYHVWTGISLEPATGNADAASMPKCFREYYSHQNPYFLITVGTDVYLKRATLYLYNSGEVKMYSKTILPQKDYFRYTSIVPGRLGAGNYYYEWEFVYSTGSSTNSNNTLQGGKVSFNVTDLTYNISYNANGGSGAPSSQTKYYDKLLSLSSLKPIRTGYTFKGWSTSSTATKASYQSGDNYISNSNVTLYAVWEKIQYNISYNANGGSGAPSTQSKYHGSTLTLRSAKPTRTGYIFKGWSTSSTATKASYQPGDNYTSNSNVTLYAVWEKIQYNISYDANGGSGAPSDQSKYYDSTITLRSGKPTRVGYTFKGWSTSSTATSASYMPGGTYTANRDMTLYAVWKAMPTATPTPRPGSSINQGTQVTSQPSSMYSSTGLYTPASAGNNKKKAAKLKIGSIVVKNSLVCKVTSLTGKKGKLKVIRLNSNKLKKVIIPQKIKMNGVNFAVTVIGKNVFNKKCKRLKVIFIKSTKLTKFEKNKISKKCKIIVPKSKVKKYTKLVKKWR